MNQNDIDKHLDEMIEKAEKDIDIVFAKRTKAIADHIAKMYRKYSDGAELSRTEIYKYNRFEKEMKFIADMVQDDYKELYRDIQELLQTTYVENMLRSGFLYSFESQEKMGYVIPKLSTVNQAILNPIAELTLSALMNTHRNEIIRNIRIEIAQGIQAGESYSEMAQRIQEKLGFSAVKAKRVARTEAGRVQTISRLDSAEIAQKHADLTKVWNATLDSRVRKAHQVLDDQEADEDGMFYYKGHKAKGPHLFGVARLDVNCRCTVLFLVNGKRPELRRARLDDGSTAVVPYQTYEEWRKSLPKSS